MRVCLRCGFTRYNKLSGACPVCNDRLVQCDGRLRKVVESLAKSEYLIAFATCETYETSEICSAEILIGFLSPYDKIIFSGLPKHFDFISDKYGNQAPYALNYVLNHIGRPMAMIMYDYYGHPAKSKPAKVVLMEAIEELYKWTLDIEENKWFVYKLAGWL